MAITFSVTTPQRGEEVLNFLRGVFGITELPPNLSPAAQNWKYFTPHPWWPTSRSYVLETEGGIAGHGCVAPIRFAAGDAVLESMVIIDWASGTLVPGAGLLVYRRCMEVGKCSLLAIGGSSDTLRILPQVRWFTPKADLRWYARPLKPWRRFRRSSMSLRDGMKFARNFIRNLASLPSAGKWTCRPARKDDPVFTPSGDFVPILRTREWLDCLGACPVAKCKLWMLENDGVALGHAFTANLGGSVRVADFALGGKCSAKDSTQAFSALVQALGTDDDAIEVVAGSSLTQDAAAFQACGLKHRRNTVVLLADPRKTFPPDAVLEIKPMLGDSFYLHDPANPFQL
jgi:hypothetical protein